MKETVRCRAPCNHVAMLVSLTRKTSCSIVQQVSNAIKVGCKQSLPSIRLFPQLVSQNGIIDILGTWSQCIRSNANLFNGGNRNLVPDVSQKRVFDRCVAKSDLKVAQLVETLCVCLWIEARITIQDHGARRHLNVDCSLDKLTSEISLDKRHDSLVSRNRGRLSRHTIGIHNVTQSRMTHGKFISWLDLRPGTKTTHQSIVQGDPIVVDKCLVDFALDVVGWLDVKLGNATVHSHRAITFHQQRRDGNPFKVVSHESHENRKRACNDTQNASNPKPLHVCRERSRSQRIQSQSMMCKHTRHQELMECGNQIVGCHLWNVSDPVEENVND
ncbi:hypothetical protein EDD86DRAFT_220527 [Gorgonomyces haynaldii]|nr:hypothetical protein EDD86DRAFT_220527 [Gorgonomyces haynaldii]